MPDNPNVSNADVQRQFGGVGGSKLETPQVNRQGPRTR